ncbi:MAG: hypothetical protein EOP84_28410, partial [Verrucomicrobiaceae bacterium]
MFRKFVILAALAVAGSANAVALYDNTDPAGSVFTAPNRNFVGDDFNFAPVGTNPAATVDNLVLGYYYNS